MILIPLLLLFIAWVITLGEDFGRQERKKKDLDQLDRLRKMNEFYKRET